MVRSPLSLNRLSHVPQGYGFSSVWRIWWRLRLCASQKDLSHCSHWKGFCLPPPSCDCMCIWKWRDWNRIGWRTLSYLLSVRLCHTLIIFNNNKCVQVRDSDLVSFRLPSEYTMPADSKYLFERRLRRRSHQPHIHHIYLIYVYQKQTTKAPVGKC